MKIRADKQAGNAQVLRILAAFLTFIAIITIATASGKTVALGASAPEIEGTAGIVYCATTDEVLWEKHADEKLNLASITKLMTCLIAAEKLGMNDVVEIKDEAVRITSTPMFSVGEKVTVEQLMYASLLASANDAAAQLAIAVSGSQADFSNLMNKRAAEIGCTATHFKNANGIHDDDHYSSARDVTLIAKEAFSNSTVKRIAGRDEYIMAATNVHDERTINNTNCFLKGGMTKTSIGSIEIERYREVFGGKTGTTNLGRATMVVGAVFDGLEVYVAVLDTSTECRYSDMKTLLDFAGENLTKYVVFEEGAVFDPVRLTYGETNKISGKTAQEGIINLPDGASPSLVEATPEYDKNLRAPLSENDVIGKVDIYLAGEYVRSVDLLAAETVPEGWFLSRFGITNFQTIIIFTVIGLILMLIIAIVIIRTVNISKRKRRRQAQLREIARRQLEREADTSRRNWPYV